MTTDKAIQITNRIQEIFLIFTCITAIGSIIRLSKGNIDSVAKAGLAFIVYFTIYMGLRYRKKWAIPIILIFSAFSLLSSVLASLKAAQNITSLAGKVFEIAFALFSAYLISFFSKKEVKELFNAKGTIIY